MKKNNKKIIISIFVFFIVLLLSSYIIISNNVTLETNFEIDEEKIYYEIKYLDTQLVYMMNLLNNVENKTNFYINWKELQVQTYNIYDYWNSVILDLNYLEIDKKSLTDFGMILDELTISINTNDKVNIANNLLELYSRLIIYSESLNNYYNAILNTKYNLLLAYSIAEKGNWTLTHEYIQKASNIFLEIVNSMENNEFNQYNINQIYISIKELENIINIKNLDIFYFKYMNSMEKLENI